MSLRGILGVEAMAIAHEKDVARCNERRAENKRCRSLSGLGSGFRV